MLPAMSTSRNIYIAVIDDDESGRRSMSRLLRAAHLQPVIYPSAEAFLTDTNRPTFACLVLDIQLTGMSGLDLRRRLSAVHDVTPVVFITAHDEFASDLQKAGAACLLKPFDQDALLSAIERACARKR